LAEPYTRGTFIHLAKRKIGIGMESIIKGSSNSDNSSITCSDILSING